MTRDELLKAFLQGVAIASNNNEEKIDKCIEIVFEQEKNSHAS
ncbi:hypothetical protein ACSLGG_01820 [Bacillus mycoides]